MRFEPIAEIVARPASATVYEEGWQSWSHAGVHRADATSRRPESATRHTMGWRPGTTLPDRGFQGEGLLAVSAPGEAARLWVAPEPEREVPSIRLEAGSDRLLVSADGPVDELVAPTLAEALAAAGERLAHPEIVSVAPGWSSWSCYFRDVTEADVAENLAALDRLGLPAELVQIDDGWQAEIGDWLDVSPRFGSLEATAARILAAGRVPGIWTTPFLVGERSRLALEHPDWLLEGADAGENWGQGLRVLDVSHPGGADYLERVYRRLAEMGFLFHKLDFLYAGALPGLDAYREGMRLIHRAAGDAVLLGCGAPLLPSIGLVEAMRIGPDVIGTPGTGPDPEEASTRSIAKAIAITGARSWMHARLWANDPDCILARPEIALRDAWAEHVERTGGVATSGDRLSDLDAHGLELTRRALRPSSTEVGSPA